ncbi:MAG: hypothetical protein HFE90_11395 [Firmicutes bacterium]|jgi:hypothetical protein|nr:hypothetical protein [Bacillota bacterium]
MSNDYMDLGKRLKKDFAEIENDIMGDLWESSEGYAALHRQLSELKAQYPVICKLLEDSSEVCLTVEEHAALKQIAQLRFGLDDMERQHLYFRGHTDAISYLKMAGIL